MKALVGLFTFLALSAQGAALAADPQDSGYPPYVMDKKIHALNDLRGKKAPALRVAKWVNGPAPHSKGKVVLLDFWATWCPDCRRLTPELNKFNQKFGKDLVIIGISDEPVKVIKKYIDDNTVDFKVASAPDRKMYNAVGVKGIPQVLVVSADGIVRWQGYADAKEDPLTDDKLALIIKTSKAAKSH